MTDQALIDRYGPEFSEAEYAILEHFREARKTREALEAIRNLPQWLQTPDGDMVEGDGCGDYVAIDDINEAMERAQL